MSTRNLFHVRLVLFCLVLSLLVTGSTVSAFTPLASASGSVLLGDGWAPGNAPSAMGGLTGYIKDAFTGEGIVGAQVTFSSNAVTLPGATDSNGSYTFANLPAGNGKLTASAEAIQAATSTSTSAQGR